MNAPKDNEFRSRYPRDHRYVSKKMLSFMPLALKTASKTLSDEQKVQKIFNSVDENGNESLDPWEMHDWMIYVESNVQKSVCDKQWHDLNRAENDNITWPDFVFKVSSICLNSCLHFAYNLLKFAYILAYICSQYAYILLTFWFLRFLTFSCNLLF